MTIIPFTPPLRVLEQSSAGRHEFPQQDDQPSSVEIDGNRVLIRGRLFHTFMSVSNAARVASALTTLEAFGLLDCVGTPREVVRGMLKASRDHARSTGEASGAPTPPTHQDGVA
jgi:hypothetical protein